MKKNKNRDIENEIDEMEETDEELTEKEQKKKKQKERAEKRKNAKKKDKVARWGGLILLGLVMFIGFLLWVSGEMKKDQIVIPPSTNSYTQIPNPGQIQKGSTIIVK